MSKANFYVVSFINNGECNVVVIRDIIITNQVNTSLYGIFTFATLLQKPETFFAITMLSDRTASGHPSTPQSTPASHAMGVKMIITNYE